MDGSGSSSWTSFLLVQSLWWAFGAFFIAALTEMCFPPFPGDSFYFVGLVILETGNRPVHGAIIAACLGGFVGFVFLYWLGRAKGRGIFREGRKGIFAPSALSRLERWLTRWGGLVIVFGRFFAGVRSAVPLVAGVGAYPTAPALVLGAVSILIWNGLLAVLALVLHESWGTVARFWSTYSLFGWIVIGLIVVGWIARYVRRRRRSSKETS